jgi:hypothetical protein
MAIAVRVVDLLPITRDFFYHPSQQGSWSIKKVMPNIFPDAPELRYDELEGVQDGNMAMDAYLEAVDPRTGTVRKAELRRQLLQYCGLDTFGLVRLWQHFSGRV